MDTTATNNIDAVATPEATAAQATPNGEVTLESLGELARCTPEMVVDAPHPPISIVILTLNEEINIADCLASCRWCDDVHVLDSGSQDKTTQIAEALGAKVYHHPFKSFGEQRNWAIDNIPTKHDWIFHLDADERFTTELVETLAEQLAADPPEAGFHLPHKVMFMGRWVKRAAGYPTYQMRLFHKTRMRFCDYGHGQRELTEGEVGYIEAPYLHFSFSKGLYDWMDKHNRYSSLEALEVIGRSDESWHIRDLFRRDKIERWRAWKAFSYHLPFRPMLRFFATLFLMGGILDGKAGWNYARLISLYERMISMKIRLIRSSQHRGLHQFEQDHAPEVRTAVFDAGDRDNTLSTSSKAASQATTTPGRSLPRDVARPMPMDGAHATVELDANQDIQMRPEASPWSFKEKLARAAWMLFGRPIFRLSFHNWYGFRNTLLRMFGGKIGDHVSIRPTVHVEIPWMLDIRDNVTVGDKAILYGLGMITIGARTTISQYTHLCAGTHDYTDPTFSLIRANITIGSDVWIGADAYVGPEVTIGHHTVVGARSSVYKDLPPNKVCGGNPCKPIKDRELRHDDESPVDASDDSSD